MRKDKNPKHNNPTEKPSSEEVNPWQASCKPVMGKESMQCSKGKFRERMTNAFLFLIYLPILKFLLAFQILNLFPGMNKEGGI